MPVVGAAQIVVRPVFPGFQTQIGRQMPGFGRRAGQDFAGGFAPEAQKGAAATFGSKAANGIKQTAQVTGAAVGGILAFAIQRGFTRLNAIEQAQAKLRGLGHDAESITNIMTSALASVKGTAFGLDEAATAAASAVAAGIKPGQELTKYLKLTADAATIAGVSFSDMGAIINQVTTAGRAQTEDLNQLSERGIPIYQWLAKQYGVTATELRKMVSEGKVDAATFRKVIEENIGGAALSAGNTTQGAFKNMQSSLGRVGANLLSGLFPQLRAGFVAITKALGPVESQAKVVGQALGSAIGGAAAAFRQHGPSVVGVLRDLFAQARSKEAGSLGDSLRRIGGGFRDMAPAVIELRSSLPSLPVLLQKIAAGTEFLARHSGLLKTALAGLVAGFALYKTAQVANTIVGRNSAAGFLLQIGATLSLAAANRSLAKSQQSLLAPTAATTAASKRQTAATVAQSLAQRAAGVASAALSVGMRAVGVAVRFALGPVGLIITAIGLLVAGLIYAYRNSETFRTIVQRAWKGVQSVVATVWGFLKNTVLPGIVGVFRSVGAAAQALWTRAIKPAWSAISSGFQAVGNAVRSVWRGFLSPVFQLLGAIVVWLAQKIFKVYVAVIVGAWRGLGTVIRSVWTGFVKPALEAFAAVAKWVWEKVLRPTWTLVKAGWEALGKLVRQRYDRDVKPILSAFGTAAKFLWEKVLSPVWSAIRSAWDTTSTKIKSGYDKTIAPTIKFLGEKVSGLKKTFEKAVDAIGRAWDGLKSAARTPVKFVIDVINGLIGKEDGTGGGFNKLATTFGTDTISQISYPPDLGFSQGGIERGFSSYRQGDTLLRGFRPGEGVTVSEALRDPYERARLLALNKAALRGETAARFRAHWLPEIGDGGYFLGGIVPHPGPYSSHGRNYYGARAAGDFGSGYGGSPLVRAWKDGVVAQVMRASTSYGNRIRINHGKEQTLYAHLRDFLVRVGDRVKGGQGIAHAGWSGNVRPRGPAGAHLHWELRGGSGPLGRIGSAIAGAVGAAKEQLVDWASDMKDRLAGPLARLRELGGTPMAQLAAAVPRKLASLMQDKAKGWAGSATSAVSGVVGKITGALGLGKAGANAAARKAGMSEGTTYPGHLPSMNKALDFHGGVQGQLKLAEHLREKHLRYGISYVISRMRIASPRGGWKWRPYSPISNTGDFRHDRHVHASFYARGTMNARRGLAVVGERQPELVNFRGGEQVAATRNQAEQIFGGPTGPQQIRGRLDLGNGLEGYLVGMIGDVVDQRDTRSANRANMPRRG